MVKLEEVKLVAILAMLVTLVSTILCGFSFITGADKGFVFLIPTLSGLASMLLIVWMLDKVNDYQYGKNDWETR
jgi:hypothetical protein